VPAYPSDSARRDQRKRLGQQALFARRAGEELCSLAFEELLVAVIDVGERVRLLLQVIARREAPRRSETRSARFDDMSPRLRHTWLALHAGLARAPPSDPLRIARAFANFCNRFSYVIPWRMMTTSIWGLQIE